MHGYIFFAVIFPATISKRQFEEMTAGVLASLRSPAIESPLLRCGHPLKKLRNIVRWDVALHNPESLFHKEPMS
jgi:hypothetical protein